MKPNELTPEAQYMYDRYMQSLKATMAYLEKHKNAISKNELLDQILIIEHLIERIINLKPETEF
jgi:hypothetical protein